MMIKVYPENAAEVLKNLKAGEAVEFQAGVYSDQMVIDLGNLSGADSDKVTILKTVGRVVISQGLTADEFREQGNIWADERQKKWDAVNKKYHFPSLVEHIHKARLTIQNSRNIQLQGFQFEKSWPTHLFIDNSQNLDILDTRFFDGTFAIAAEGAKTYGITIDNCQWQQDIEPDRIWRKIPWWRIHGAVGDGYPPVDLKEDWRIFDGDFFRGYHIKGGVTISNSHIGQAFNAIHFFNLGKKLLKKKPEKAAQYSLDVNVHDCEFTEIRDNVLEAEAGATNWWFWNNSLKNIHKPFSIEIYCGGGFYLFANKVWFDSIQGPEGYDANRGGGLFKFSKKDPKHPEPSLIPSYFFHNSIFSRADYMRKGQLSGLSHFNNAVYFLTPADADDEKFIEDIPEIFGNLSVSPKSDWANSHRFNNEWKHKKISFRNDVFFHESYPQILIDNQYNLCAHEKADDPRFKNRFAGDFSLEKGSPCIGTSLGAKISLLGKTQIWDLPAEKNIGAIQDENNGIDWPKFEPVNV